MLEWICWKLRIGWKRSYQHVTEWSRTEYWHNRGGERRIVRIGLSHDEEVIARRRRELGIDGDRNTEGTERDA